MYKMLQLEHNLRFYRNTVEISENSENHLKAIVGGQQMAGVDGVSDRGGKVVGKTQGEGKALKSGRTELAVGGGECWLHRLADMGKPSVRPELRDWAA